MSKGMKKQQLRMKLITVEIVLSFCHNLQHWVFFWYLATYFWTFFFAVDVYNSKHGGKWRLSCSHNFTWFFSIVFVSGSGASLWACPPFLRLHKLYVEHDNCTTAIVTVYA